MKGKIMIFSNKNREGEKGADWITLKIKDPFLNHQLHCSGVGEKTFFPNQPLSLDCTLSHAKQDYGIFAILEGSLDVEIIEKDISRNHFLLKQDSAIIISPCSTISPKLPTCAGECVFAFLGGNIAQNTFETMAKRSGSVIFTSDTKPLMQRIEQLLYSLYLGIAVDDCYISEFAYQLLMHLYRASIDAGAYIYPPLVESALKLIKEEYAYLYGIDEVADSLDVSKSHLIRAFTQAVGVSPGKYLTQIRIENAKLLLLSGLYSVETTGNLSGYGDANYFCKVFKKHTGATPKQFMLSHPQAKKQLPKHIEKSEGFLY